MKYFVLTVLLLYDKLESFCDSLDKTAIATATSIGRDAEELCYALMEINDKKRLLANMKVMRDEIAAGIGEKETDLLTRYALGASAERLGCEENVSRSTVLRRINRAVAASETILSRLGIDTEKVESEYFSVGIIRSAYEKTAAARSPKNKLTPRSSAAFSYARRLSANETA